MAVLDRTAPASAPPSPSPSPSPGRASRRVVPRTAHGEWTPSADRRDPVEILEQEAMSRLPDLVPIRYGRMLASEFTFYRGAAGIMAADLAQTPVSGLTVQCCGDAHLLNFGAYAAPDRKLVFDVNDFDETLPAPWEWDVKRLCASIEVAARARGDRPRVGRALVATAARAYREAMSAFAATGTLALWYARIDEDELLREFRPSGRSRPDPALLRAREKARRKNSARAMSRLTERVDGRVRFRADPPLIVPISEVLPPDRAQDVQGEMERLLDGYRETLSSDRQRLLEAYHVVDMARKVVGVGSVGTRAWVLLLHGRDASDPLVLQAKEAGESVLAPYAGASPFANQGRRVVEGQRLMQAASDLLLGWQRVVDLAGVPRDFYVRQLWDGKFSPDVEAMPLERLAGYVRVCAWTLARGHARSGDRVAIADYLGRSDAFDRAMVRFARSYADQNARDYRALLEAVQGGRLRARPGI